MIRTEATGYGYRSTFVDPVDLGQLDRWLADLRAAVAGRAGFGQLLDLRGRLTCSGPPEQEAKLTEAVRWVKANGLLRSAVVVPNQRVAVKIKRISFAAAVYEWERYLDAGRPDWEQAALGWILRGLEP